MTKTQAFRKFVTDMMKDERGSFSIKPFIAVFGTLALTVSLFVSGFTKKEFQPSDAIVEAIMIITIVGMGADTLDKFSLRGKSTKKEEPTEPEV